MAAPKMMIVIFGVAALVVGAIAALALDSWWILVAALALHAIGSMVVIGYGWMRASDTGDKPDPVTAARLEEEEGAETAESRAPDREVFN